MIEKVLDFVIGLVFLSFMLKLFSSAIIELIEQVRMLIEVAFM